MGPLEFRNVCSRGPTGCSFSQLHCGTIASWWMRQSRIFEKEQGGFKSVNEGLRPDGPVFDSFTIKFDGDQVFSGDFKGYLIETYSAEITLSCHIWHNRW